MYTENKICATALDYQPNPLKKFDLLVISALSQYELINTFLLRYYNHNVMFTRSSLNPNSYVGYQIKINAFTFT